MANLNNSLSDGAFADWLLNFSNLLTAAPTTYGLLAGDAVIVATQNTAYQAAYVVANDPSTRTPAAIAAKDSAKANALAVVRPYVVRISNNPAVSDEDKTAIGATVKKPVPSPVPTPTAIPQVSLVSLQPLQAALKIVNAATPTSKAKPFGSIGVELWAATGTTAAVDPEQLNFQFIASKIPTVLEFLAAQQGKICTVAARYSTRGGIGGKAKTGPWSALLTFTVA